MERMDIVWCGDTNCGCGGGGLANLVCNGKVISFGSDLVSGVFELILLYMRASKFSKLEAITKGVGLMLPLVPNGTRDRLRSQQPHSSISHAGFEQYLYGIPQRC